MLCICGLAVFFSRYAKDFFGALVATYFSLWLLVSPITHSDKQTASRVHVSYSNEAYDMLVAWVSSQPFPCKACSFLASVGARRKRFADNHSNKNQKKPLQYSPWNRSFSFCYKNRLLTFRSV
jgi:chaperone BCS1